MTFRAIIAADADADYAAAIRNGLPSPPRPTRQPRLRLPKSISIRREYIIIIDDAFRGDG